MAVSPQDMAKFSQDYNSALDAALDNDNITLEKEMQIRKDTYKETVDKYMTENNKVGDLSVQNAFTEKARDFGTTIEFSGGKKSRKSKRKRSIRRKKTNRRRNRY